MLKIIVPNAAITFEFQLLVVTQLPVSGNGKFLKELREVRSEFKMHPRYPTASASQPAPDSGTA
jgi:hypothetical protein